MAQNTDFIEIMHPSNQSAPTQGLMDFVTRFMVFMYVKFDRRWDVEEYLNNGTIELAELSKKEFSELSSTFNKALKLLIDTKETDLLRRFKEGKFQGRVGQAAFETIFLGVAQNIKSIEARQNPSKFILTKAKSLWSREDVSSFTRAGLRGTDRIAATVPFGKKWFAA